MYCRQPEIDFKTIVMGEHLGSGSVGEVSLGGVESRRRAEKSLRSLEWEKNCGGDVS